MSEAIDPAQGNALVPTPAFAPALRPAAAAHPQAPEALPSALPAVQAAALAAGGFAAGAALVGLFHRRRRSALTFGRRRRFGRRAAPARGRAGRAAELVQIVGSRSLLVDVHLLGGPGER